MKSTIMHLLSLFLIVGFSASCGKKESGGSSAAPVVNNVSTPVNSTGVVAQQNLTNWYNSVTEGAKPSAATFPSREVFRYSRSASANCTTQQIWILGSINLCSSGSIGWGSPVSEGYVTLIPSGDKKVNNSKLASALAPMLTAGTNGLYLMNITETPSQQSAGSVFTLTYRTSDNKTVTHIIDSGYNSRLNPVYSNDPVVSGKETSLASTYPSLAQ